MSKAEFEQVLAYVTDSSTPEERENEQLRTQVAFLHRILGELYERYSTEAKAAQFLSEETLKKGK